jgi:1-acyl-sn-glycerol-3-phosphate acyltransferase
MLRLADGRRDLVMTGTPGTPSDTFERLLAIVKQMVQETHPGRSFAITLHSSLERDLELDSLARVELMLRIGQAFRVELPTEALAEAATPHDIMRFLDQGSHQQIAEPATVLPGTAHHSVPESARTLVEMLEWHTARQPERIHILLYDERQTEQLIRYQDLLEAASSTAAGLIAHGLQARQTVALMLPTGYSYLASFFGVMIAGGIPVPIYPPARLSQLSDHLNRHARILSNAETTLIITLQQAKPVALMLRAAVSTLGAIVTPDELRGAPLSPPYRAQASDIAFLQYTSGSTGDPKGVVLTHANLLANIRAMGQATKATSEDVFVSWLPLYHDMGLISAWFGSMYHGMPLVLMSPLAFLAGPARWLQAITRHRGTISGAPNFAYELCARNIPDAALARIDLSSWRLAFNGAEPVSPATLESFATRFAPCGLRRQALAPVYGLAESSVALTIPPPGRGPQIDVIRRDPFLQDGRAMPAPLTDTDRMSVPCCGRPLPGHEIRIVDATGRELPERCIGRLEFRGPSATIGYYRNPEGTAKLRHGDWLDSGDYAYMAQGELYVTGRAKDLIKRAGRNVYPYDLEATIGNIQGIRKGCVAVFASRDPVLRTERLVVMAETREQSEPVREKLRKQINETAIAVVGTPADDVVLAPPHSVLKTSSGKIRRIACRETYERGDVGKTGQYRPTPWLDAARLIKAAAIARATLAARVTAGWAYGCFSWAVFLSLALPTGGLIALIQRPMMARPLAQVAARAFVRLTAIPVSVSGLTQLPATPHVLLVNHASYLDGILLTAILPATPGYVFVAKHELSGPIRAALKGLGTIFVDRFDAVHSVADLSLMSGALGRKENLLVFPEGTFRREPGLRPFHAGAFLAAARTNVPVVTAGLRGTRAVLRSGTWFPRRGPVSFEVGPLIAPTGQDWAATSDMSNRARIAMVRLSGEFDSVI